MTDALLAELLAARARGERCALATVATTRGSVPREAGAKALIFVGGRIVGTIGGGKFESLVIADALAAMEAKAPLLKTYPLHEESADSFGAICGGEVTVLIEPQLVKEVLVVVGAGHCGQALCRLARECGWHVTVLDDRPELLAACEAHERTPTPAPEFIATRQWGGDEALVIVSRNFEIDREALAAALQNPGAGYVGMIGSTRKVRRIFDDLRARGFDNADLARVFAPIGLDLGADSPAEIAVSVFAEMLRVLRGRSGGHLRADQIAQLP
jgi:xanthine dehydrogenase accessory factor